MIELKTVVAVGCLCRRVFEFNRTLALGNLNIGLVEVDGLVLDRIFLLLGRVCASSSVDWSELEDCADCARRSSFFFNLLTRFRSSLAIVEVGVSSLDAGE